MERDAVVCVAEVDQAQPSEREVEALHALLRAEVAQTRPHDAVRSADGVRRALAAAAAMRSYSVRTALAWRGDVAMGQVTTASSRKGDNEHLLQVEAFVAPDLRRQGAGTHLLRWALARAHEDGRVLLIGTSTDRA
ncbi:MAG: GNAT family N-acetyltransferase, partial [Bacteroidales bacterium]